MGPAEVKSVPENSDFRSDRPPAPDELQERAVEIFKARLEAREKREGITFLAATGLVEIDGEIRKVWAGCPRRNPGRNPRRQANLMAPIFGWHTNSRGKLSGRQWKILRRTARRHQRLEEAKKLATNVVTPANELISV